LYLLPPSIFPIVITAVWLGGMFLLIILCILVIIFPATTIASLPSDGIEAWLLLPKISISILSDLEVATPGFIATLPVGIPKTCKA